MFKDLKEYQEITQLYHDSVNISEEQREINKIFVEAEFTAEEIQYLDENFDELWERELATLTEESVVESLRQENLTEEQLNEVLGLALAAKGAKAMGGMVKKGIKAVAKRIPKNIKTGVKDIARGTKEVAKSAIKKVKPALKKVGGVLKRVPGIALPAAAIGGAVAGINKLRNIGKDKREAEANKNKDAEGKTIPSTAEIRKNSKNQIGTQTDSGEGKTYTSTPTQGTPPDKKTETKTTESKPKKMHSIEKKNRARFGDKHVDKLKAKNKDFKLMRSKKMSKDDFIKKYPKSITAQKAAGLRDHTEWDAYDMVLEYLYSTEQVSSLEEANYVMMEMEQQTIGEIVKEVTVALEEKVKRPGGLDAPDMKYVMSHGMSDETFAKTAQKTFSGKSKTGKDGYSDQHKFTAELMRRQGNTGTDFSGKPLYKKKDEKK